MTEQWKDIPGYEGWYQVSDQGEVKRVGKSSGAIVGRVLKQKIRKLGYRGVTLSKNCQVHDFTVHKLVMLAFVGERPSGYEINHKNGISSDNRLENLEYVTPKENQFHKNHVLGRYCAGERSGASKLNRVGVFEIYRLRAEGLTIYQIAEQIKISPTQVARIARGELWKREYKEYYGEKAA